MTAPLTRTPELDRREHTNLQFNPNARADDQDTAEPLPAGYVPPRLDV